MKHETLCSSKQTSSAEWGLVIGPYTLSGHIHYQAKIFILLNKFYSKHYESTNFINFKIQP